MTVDMDEIEQPRHPGRAIRVCSACAEYFVTAGLMPRDGGYQAHRIAERFGDEEAFVVVDDRTDPVMMAADTRCDTCQRLGPQSAWSAWVEGVAP